MENQNCTLIHIWVPLVIMWIGVDDNHSRKECLIMVLWNFRKYFTYCIQVNRMQRDSCTPFCLYGVGAWSRGLSMAMPVMVFCVSVCQLVTSLDSSALQQHLGLPVTGHDIIKMAKWEGDRKWKWNSKVDCGVWQDIHLFTVRQEFQTIVNSINTPAHSQRLASVSLSVLWKTFPPKVRHEETHLHPHWYVVPRVH